jgi:hypothetical protein
MQQPELGTDLAVQISPELRQIIDSGIELPTDPNSIQYWEAFLDRREGFESSARQMCTFAASLAVREELFELQCTRGLVKLALERTIDNGVLPPIKINT